MKMSFGKKLFAVVCLMAAITAFATVSASACTTIYVGGNLTEEGAPIVARSEDYVNSQNKLFYISKAGEFKAGESYIGCLEYGGFEWTWSHDSYRFTAFTADVIHDGVCPECGEPGHPSYTESGTNEKGVSVSATETISANADIRAADPYCREKTEDGKVGIEETDIPTVILAEAATAREGVELLLAIYDEYGCYGGSGLFIADQNEIWYVENCTGTQYVALKLNNDVMFLEPNMSTIGVIDLDDENIIASDKIIEIAQAAGTFVGDAEKNIIDYRASYGNEANIGGVRLVNGLNFVNAANSYVADDLTGVENSVKFCISNLNDKGEIVPLYTNIKADRLFTVDDIVNYYKVDGISNTGNTDTAFFQLFADRPVETATVEWMSLDTGAYNVFIPYYPVVLTEVNETFGAAVGEATKGVADKPSEGMFYLAPATRYSPESFTVLPEGWETSYYWAFDALNNYINYTDNGTPANNAAKAYVLSELAQMQQKIYSTFRTNDAVSAAAVNAGSNQMAGEAQALAVKLVDFLRSGKLPFADVADSAYYADAVAWAVQQNITSGTSATKFGPDASCTRAQAVTFLWRAAGCPEAENAAQFADVAADAYYAKAVAWAVEQGITNGMSDTAFKPDATCTRAQIVTFLWRAAESAEAQAASQFADVAADAYYAGAVAWAVENDITKGTSETKFSPDASCTRAQIVTFLYRAAE